MKLLNKYHKQKLDKKTIKKYQKLITDYKLPYTVKDDKGCLYTSIFETGLRNKNVFQSQFEAIRNANIDMWDNLSYQERNFIIKCDIVVEKTKLKKFVFEEQNIYIPFFDRLLNHLYDEETAILELPQYFKLYDQFTDRINPVEIYGLLPFESDMSFAKHIATKDNLCVLYDKQNAVFYKLGRDFFERYPILQKVSKDGTIIKKVANALLEDDTLFIDALIEESMIHPKCIKKIEKYRKKGKVI